MRGRPRKNDVSVQHHGNVIEMYESGKGLVEIANKFNVTTYIIKGILNLNGVETRKPGKRKLATRMSPITDANRYETDTQGSLTSPLGAE